jgi:hypothetical protein
LKSCPKLKEFYIKGHLPLVDLPPFTLSQLTVYSGSMAAAPGILKGTKVRDIQIVDQASELKNLLPFLAGLSRSAPDIQSLDIHVKEWDLEIIYAISQLFPNLRSLVIKYSQGALTEVCGTWCSVCGSN